MNVVTVDSDKAWAELMKQPCTMVVADIHSNWCGPCKAALPLFRRLQAETDMGRAALVIAQVDADHVEMLKEYAGTSQPRFHVYVNSKIAGELVGINASKLRDLAEKAIEETKSSLKPEEPMETGRSYSRSASRSASRAALSRPGSVASLATSTQS